MKAILICMALFLILSVSAVAENDSEEVQEPEAEDNSEEGNNTYLEDVGEGLLEDLEDMEPEEVNYSAISDNLIGKLTEESKARRILFQLVMAVTLIAFSIYLFKRVLSQTKAE